MKFDSPLFDRIRVKPTAARRPRAESPVCEWAGCGEQATHRAPKGRLREQEYWRFCLLHVREYNHSYNYFSGMSDDAVSRYQKDAVTGHRPTWKMGVGRRGAGPSTHAEYEGANDPFGMFREFGGNWRPQAERAEPAGRSIRNAERKALSVLGLELDATAADIKAKFKLLVKRHHPDANGGDRAYEDILRDIIQAYKYLKSVQFG
jgi:DnaJ domain